MVDRYNCYHRLGDGHMSDSGTQNINPYEIVDKGTGCFLIGPEGYFNGNRVVIPVRNVTFIEMGTFRLERK